MDIKRIKKNSVMVAETLKILSHPQRLCILCHLSEGKKTVGELQSLCGISQSHVSQFLSKMKLQSLVDANKQGNYVYYSVKDQKVLEVLEALHGIYCT